MSKINEMFDMKGKVAVITGGTGLLGMEYLDKDKCEKNAKILKKEFKNKMLGIKTDISNQKEVKSMAAKVEKEFGKIDVLVNNAAFNCPADNKGSNFVSFEDYPLELWKKSIDVNLTGMFICSQEVIRLMIKKKIKGSIINVSSTYGLVGPDQRIYHSIKHPKDSSKKFVKPVDYSTTKSGVLNFTRYLAALYGKNGIRVNTLTPGGVLDNQDEDFVEGYSNKTVLGKMAEKTDYNGAVLFLASDASKYMTGSNLVIDGGWTCW
jgi:NAD(P)-dependent dehydrogenase (short-subunit alcohol dehydrogenase family)